jgi:hypothetical protein
VSNLAEEEIVEVDEGGTTGAEEELRGEVQTFS